MRSRGSAGHCPEQRRGYPKTRVKERTLDSKVLTQPKPAVLGGIPARSHFFRFGRSGNGGCAAATRAALRDELPIEDPVPPDQQIEQEHRDRREDEPGPELLVER